MLRIVICDDDEQELNQTKELCYKYAAKHTDLDLRIESFATATDLWNRIVSEQYDYDILLLDIYMPEMTGVELARRLREKADHCQIIFLTTSKEHAVEAFSLNAVHYLVKPYTKSQLEEALDKAIIVVEKVLKSNLLLKTTEGLQRINISNIIYSETNKHHQIMHLQDGTCLQVRITCSDLYDMLSVDERFYKCGSTYIINLDIITQLTTKSILLSNGEKLTMLRRQYRDLVDQYTRYLLKI